MDHWTENYCQEDNVNKACNVIKKETLAQVFSYEFCEISKNNFSYRTPPVAVSAYYQKLSEEQQIFLKQSSTV